MDFLPLFHHIQNYPALVVGGGEIAYRKAQLLIQAGAKVTVVSPELCENLNILLAEHASLIHSNRTYTSDDIAQQRLVVAATNDVEVNAQIAKDARAANIEVNVVDQPDLGTFIFPSIIDRSPVMVAVSSGGRAPVLTRLLRARLESLVPNAYGRLAALVGKYRPTVKTTFDTVFKRRQFWERVLYGPIAELMFSGKEEQAELRLKEAIEKADPKADTGEVYLVGAGPGDPDLLTFKALRLMQQADVVVYDSLVSQPIRDLVRRDAELIHVGKRRSNHTLPQEEINELLVRLAQTGKRVLRLKGGDPFIFGRGGEEIDKLAEHGIPFQVVPAVTAAAGCAAYAGIPLTHRDCAQSVRFVTGHLKDGTANLPWFELVRPAQTIVFYMGLVGLPHITRELIAHGMSEDTPIALVQKGTTPDQRVFEGTLANINDVIANEQVKAPTLIIVGQVVALRRKLKWDRN